MLWSKRAIYKMTQVKRVAARPAPSRKQQRFSLIKIVGALAVISCLVIFLLRSDPFPGVRKAAMRHRQQNENENVDSSRKLGSDKVEIGEIKEEKKQDGETNDSNGGRTYTFELSNLDGGKSGEIVIETRPEWAPLGVEQLHTLLDDHFYDNAKFFRVVDNFVVQFGIPAVPSNKYKKPIKDDPVIETNARGTLTYATSGANTRTTQLFINTRKGGNKFLDNQGFAPIGVVTKGMDLVDQIYSGYGEKPNQGKIQNKGNEYLDKEFPLLTYISTTSQV